MHNISNNLPPDSNRRIPVNPQIANLQGSPKQGVPRTPPIFSLNTADSLQTGPQTEMVAGLPPPRSNDWQRPVLPSDSNTDSIMVAGLPVPRTDDWQQPSVNTEANTNADVEDLSAEENLDQSNFEADDSSPEGFSYQLTEFFRRLGINFNFSSIFGSRDKTEYYASQNEVEVQTSGNDKY